MNKASFKDWITTCASAVLILLWVYAGSKKLWGIESFRFQLQSYPFAPGLQPGLVWLIPLLELSIAILLLFAATRLVGFIVSAIYLLTVSGFLFWIYLTFGEVPCGCGAPVGALSGWEHLGFNLFFTCAALIGIISLKNQEFKKEI